MSQMVRFLHFAIEPAATLPRGVYGQDSGT